MNRRGFLRGLLIGGTAIVYRPDLLLEPGRVMRAVTVPVSLTESIEVPFVFEYGSMMYKTAVSFVLRHGGTESIRERGFPSWPTIGPVPNRWTLKDGSSITFNPAIPDPGITRYEPKIIS